MNTDEEKKAEEAAETEMGNVREKNLIKPLLPSEHSS
jgi:hypothetical protein